MEATIFTGWIFAHLLPHPRQVKLAHPLMLRAITAAKKKNDRIDADKIATACAATSCRNPKWHPSRFATYPCHLSRQIVLTVMQRLSLNLTTLMTEWEPTAKLPDGTVSRTKSEGKRLVAEFGRWQPACLFLKSLFLKRKQAIQIFN
jgi:hypothetical protein